MEETRQIPELSKLLDRANTTGYIKHYKALEQKYRNGKELFNKMNDEFYGQIWKNIKDANNHKTKLKAYFDIYNESEKLPDTSLSLKIQSRRQQKTISLYIMSSHNLESEKGRWFNTPKHERVFRQCTSGLEETLNHFIFKCEKFHIVRTQYANFPISQRLTDFFNLANCALEELHTARK